MTTDPTDRLHRFGEVRHELEARWPESQISPTLDRIRTLTQFLGDPQRAYPVIHVTGTNGKTSTARMIESLLRSFGLHTGLITSPHLSDLRERIRLDGEPISIDAFLDIYDEVAPVLAMADEASELEGGPRLSFFEVMTGLAFAAFADAPVDVAVVEVGMGGTWDATNVADGQVAVIMPIGMDHSDYLGDTLADIAGEKAGIIKPTSSVVLAAQDDEAMEVLAAAASQMEAPTAVEGIHFGVLERLVAVGGQQVTLRGLGADYEEVFLPLFGAHQARNAVAALAAVESFFGITSSPNRADAAQADPRDGSPIDIRDGVGAEGVATDIPVPTAGRRLDPVVVRAGLAAVTSPGRLEIVRRAPTVVVDAAHNVPGAQALAAADRGLVRVHLVGGGGRHPRGQGCGRDPRRPGPDHRHGRHHAVELAAGPARRGAGRDRRRGPGRGARRGRRSPRCRPGTCDRAGGSRVAGRGRRRRDRHRVGHDGRGGAAAPRRRVGA